ncbi:Spherulation-specific family 4 [Penicillium taxi]|uniref:Spherulation-specific family 4 n=1 Tax=Penicillium taxi TaxID=168475 RepID=UPI002545432F|nr:Spherulation-specific family 4 [Penicillium taxi]KAJ5899416.1 Spherulation-specific family 4 [Penicillium taxi]
MLGFTYVLGVVLAMSSVVSATSILLPLYLWPTSTAIWGPVYNAVATYPDVLFQIIINPSSGPGYSQYPEDDYILAIAKLNRYNNTRLIGYIPTEYAQRDISEVEQAISVYSGWSSYTKRNIALSGIFFDEAPRTNDDTTIQYMKTVSAKARSSNLPTVVFNPGTKVEEGSAPSYFGAANFIVEFENSYDTWTTTIPTEQLSSQKYHKQDAVLLYNAPLTADYETVVAEAKQMGLGAVYLTNVADYASVDSVHRVATAFTQA